MADINENDTHPSALSEADKAAMNKLVEGDDGGEGGDVVAAGADDAGTVAQTPKKPAAKSEAGDDPDAGLEAGGQDEGAGKTAPKAAGEGGDDKKPQEAFVSKREFDGVLHELRQTRSQLSALRGGPRDPLPERNFDDEDKVLDSREKEIDDKYDEGELTEAEHRAKLRAVLNERRALDRERARYEARAEIEQEQTAAAERLKQAAQAEWDAAIKGWEEGLGDWMQNPVRRTTVAQTLQFMENDPELSKLDNAAFLDKLEEFLADAFPNFPAKADRQQRVSDRQKLAATRAAEASAAPGRMEGGSGNRATRTEDIDVNGLKLGDFGKLPKHKQDELLGLT